MGCMGMFTVFQKRMVASSAFHVSQFLMLCTRYVLRRQLRQVTLLFLGTKKKQSFWTVYH